MTPRQQARPGTFPQRLRHHANLRRIAAEVAPDKATRNRLMGLALLLAIVALLWQNGLLPAWTVIATSVMVLLAGLAFIGFAAMDNDS